MLRRRRARPRPRARTPSVDGDRGRAARRAGRGARRHRSTSSLCLSVLEHLWEPQARARRVAPARSRPAASLLVNVPVVARQAVPRARRVPARRQPARRRWTTTRRYYDPRDLWPMLVAAGFRPSGIRCRRHKFGLNTFAACRCRPPPEQSDDDVHRRRTSTRPGRSSTRSTRDAIEAVAAGLAAVRDARRPAVHPRRRRLGRARRPRRQRLPQALRVRGLRAHRQRLRADRAHQRRGLGHHVLRLARRARASAPTTRCWSSRSAAATPSADVSRQPRPGARARRARCGAGVFGIVGRDGGHTAQRRRRLRRRSRRCSPSASRRTPRGCARSSGTCSSATRRCSGTPTKWESVAASRWRVVSARSLHRRRRRLHRQPLHRRACSPTPRRERVTLYDNFIVGPRVALRRPRRRPAPRRRPRRRRSDLDALRRGDGRPRPRHPPGVEPRHRRGDDRPDDRLRRGHAAHPPRRRGDAPTSASRRIPTPPAAASTATSASDEAARGPRPAGPGLDLRRAASSPARR